MAKRPSMVYQVNQALKEQARFGQSKHEAKIAARAQGKQNPDGIFSIKTMETYREQSITFANWAKTEHGCRTLEEAKNYAGEYLSKNIERGDSAWTAQLQRASLRKLYQDPALANDVQLPIRHKAEVERSRGEKPSDKHFSEDRNRDIVDFQRGVGLRRHELAAITPADVYQQDGKVYVHVEQGKGGRPREVPVLPEYQEHILNVAQSVQEPAESIFDYVPIHMDCHGYRREYAQELYAQLAGGYYEKGSPDRDALQEVSNALGHNRLDVVIRSYL